MSRVPLFVKDDFANFYKATFDRAVTRANMRDVFDEYAWNMNLCDPCSADAMTESELLQELGVPLSGRPTGGDASVDFTNAGDTCVTRLHLRYDAKSLPEDLNFIETGDRENFQARYILQHPYVGKTSSADGAAYRASLPVWFNKKRKASPM